MSEGAHPFEIFMDSTINELNTDTAILRVFLEDIYNLLAETQNNLKWNMERIEKKAWVEQKLPVNCR